MDVKYTIEQSQINIAKDNSTLNATQVINCFVQKKLPKLMTSDPIPYSHYVSRNNEDEVMEKSIFAWRWWNRKNNICKKDISAF